MTERSDRQLLEALLEAMERVAAGIGRLEELACSHNDATRELARRNKLHSEAEKRSRAKRRHSDATQPKPAESLKPAKAPWRQNGVTPQVVKAFAFAVGDQDKDQNKILQRGVTLTPRQEADPPTRPVWTAYSTAYRLRYGVLPVRNRKVNGQLAQFVARVPADCAPEIAAFYVGHNEAFYVRDRHGVGLLLKDAEKLHTDWKSGRPMTSTEARQADRTQANVVGWAGLLKEKPNAVG